MQLVLAKLQTELYEVTVGSKQLRENILQVTSTRANSFCTQGKTVGRQGKNTAAGNPSIMPNLYLTRLDSILTLPIRWKTPLSLRQRASALTVELETRTLFTRQSVYRHR